MEGHYETVIFHYTHGIYFLRRLGPAGLAAAGQQRTGDKSRSYYVETDTFYMKREALESSLLGQKEFKAWDLQVT